MNPADNQLYIPVEVKGAAWIVALYGSVWLLGYSPIIVLIVMIIIALGDCKSWEQY